MGFFLSDADMSSNQIVIFWQTLVYSSMYQLTSIWHRLQRWWERPYSRMVPIHHPSIQSKPAIAVSSITNTFTSWFPEVIVRLSLAIWSCNVVPLLLAGVDWFPCFCWRNNWYSHLYCVRNWETVRYFIELSCSPVNFPHTYLFTNSLEKGHSLLVYSLVWED